MSRKSLLVIALIAGLFSLSCLPASAQTGPRRQGSVTVAKPRKATEAETTQPAETKPEETQGEIPSEFRKRKEQLPEDIPTFRADVWTVNVDVAVVDDNGRFIPNIPEQYFRIFEDGVPQKIKTFEVGQAPMTVALVIEFSNLFQTFWSETWYQTLYAAYGFVENLGPEDYVAVVAYDLRPEILTDFTQNRQEIYGALQRLRIAAYREANLFDAVTFVAERMTDIEGRKAIVLISSGMDTFSKITFDDARKILQRSGVPIYAIGLMQALREWLDARGYLGPMARMDFLMADNFLRTFAKETGGMAFFPRFYGEFPGIFQAISESLRNRYFITYTPTNQNRDGKFRKIEVKLIDPQSGKELRITTPKGKRIKYEIIARRGYYAPKPVE